MNSEGCHMDSRLRNKQREGRLTSRDLVRAGINDKAGLKEWRVPTFEIRNLGLLTLLTNESGWVDTGTSVTRGPDCKGWMHCGPGCCGPCPTCGDNWSRKEYYLVATPAPMGFNKAKKSLNKLMDTYERRLRGHKYMDDLYNDGPVAWGREGRRFPADEALDEFVQGREELEAQEEDAKDEPSYFDSCFVE